jgi:uncharacterized RDD family membrane protein YckC
MTRHAGEEESLIGHYAGAMTRFVAYIVDTGIIFGSFVAIVALVTAVLHLVIGADVSINPSSPWWSIPLAGWWFLYYWYCYMASGKTPGKTLLGLRVVRSDGSNLHGGRAAIRVLAFPLSFLCFGLGFFGIIVGRQRHALHDVIADTSVVYDFDAKAAKLRFLARRAEPKPKALPQSSTSTSVEAQPQTST